MSKKIKSVKKKGDMLEAEYEETNLFYRQWNRIFGGCKIRRVNIENLYINQSGSPPTPPPPYEPPK
ncbi:MAG TPA: hypothetical protein VGK46_12895 [Saprospiraceae bacterium]